jgi:hypothetical protein
MKIHLRQKSGLGNQLFQYAAGIFFARKYGATLEVIREADERASSFGHPRPFLLPKFCITSTTRERNGRDRLLCSTAGAKSPLAKTARLFTGTRLHRPHFETDWVFVPDLPVSSSTQNIYLDGYFQAHQYAAGVEEHLRSELNLCQAPQGRNLEIFHLIEDSAHSISLHVRRGDYTKIYGGRDALPMTYYQNAIEYVRERVADPTFFVFSDDIAFSRENLPAGPRYVFVDHNGEIEAHEDLRLMSSCRDHIIANSSFSWWGAWLNPDNDKVVIAPNRWLDPAVPNPDLIPPTWQRITATETTATINA